MNKLDSYKNISCLSNDIVMVKCENHEDYAFDCRKEIARRFSLPGSFKLQLVQRPKNQTTILKKDNKTAQQKLDDLIGSAFKDSNASELKELWRRLYNEDLGSIRK
jgi:hypothetical protein